MGAQALITKVQLTARLQTCDGEFMPRAKKDEDGLTPMQRKFVMKLLADPAMRGGKAARDAGYSQKNADCQAHHILKLPQVKAVLEKEMLARSKRTGITADMVLRELAILAFSDKDNYEIVDGDVVPVDGADPAVTRAISSIKVRRGDDFTEVEYKVWDKTGPLKMLAAHLNICVPKSDVNVKGSLFDLICKVEEQEKAEQDADHDDVPTDDGDE